MARDRYSSFDELRRHEREGIDFRICVTQRGPPVAVIAPHGGKIEPATSEITAAIAGALYSSYYFEGLRSRPHSHLHITSTKFDEPKCLALISMCDLVVAVHGLAGRRKAVDVGGRDHQLRDLIDANLHAAGFDSKIITSGSHAATSRSNICNKGRRGAGVQLEITKALRDDFMQGARSRKLADFADAVANAIADASINWAPERVARGRAARPEVSYNLHARRRLCRWGRYEAEMSINLMQRAHAAPRCTARSKRTGKRCRAPAVRGWKVCRMHDARGGAPKGKRNGNYKHGARSMETIELWKRIKSLR